MVSVQSNSSRIFIQKCLYMLGCTSRKLGVQLWALGLGGNDRLFQGVQIHSPKHCLSCSALFLRPSPIHHDVGPWMRHLTQSTHVQLPVLVIIHLENGCFSRVVSMTDVTQSMCDVPLRGSVWLSSSVVHLPVDFKVGLNHVVGYRMLHWKCCTMVRVQG